MSDHEQNKKGAATSPESPFDRLMEKCAKTKKIWEPFVWGLSVMGGIVIGLYLVLGPRVEETARKAVLSPEVLNEISSKLRPYAVIHAYLNNPSATFEYDDNGAFSEVVDSVDFRQGDEKFIGILTFKMKKFVRLPLVRPLTPGVYVQSFWHTNKFDWVFEIRPSAVAVSVGGVVTGGMSDDIADTKDCRFFVELLTK